MSAHTIELDYCFNFAWGNLQKAEFIKNECAIVEVGKGRSVSFKPSCYF